MAMVTPDGESMPPMETTTGTAAPVVALAGTVTFIWSKPGTDPTGDTALITLAACPPIVTVGEAEGTTAGLAGIRTLAVAEFVAPMPVA